MIERQRPKLPRPRANLLDRAIAVVSPAVANRRVAARWRFEMMTGGGGYQAARSDRAALRGWNPNPRAADEDTLPNLALQRSRARDLHMNGPLARGAVMTTVSNVVGTGLRVTAQPDRQALEAAGISDDEAEAAETAMEREWRLFTAGTGADVQRRLTWPQIQELAFGSHLVSGDTFAAFVEPQAGGLFDFALQLIEADAVCNPNRRANSEDLAEGIEYAGGIPVAVHVAEIPRMGLGGPRNWRRLPILAPDGSPRVLHLMRPDRIGQSRGVPFLAPVMAALKDLDQYSEAELRAAVLNACIAVMGETPEGAAPLAEEAAATGNSDSAQAGLRRMDLAFEPGMVLEGFMPGEKLESFGTERPASGFDPFVMAILRQIGAALELPFEVLVKHFTASYSAARAALLEAWKFFRGRRAYLATALCQPVYEQVIANAVLRGRLDLPGFRQDPLLRAAWLQAVWNGDSPGQINPEVEVRAAVERIGATLSTRTRETAELTGENWDSVRRQAAKEQRLMREDGLATVLPGQAAPQPLDQDQAAQDAEDRPEDETA